MRQSWHDDGRLYCGKSYQNHFMLNHTKRWYITGNNNYILGQLSGCTYFKSICQQRWSDNSGNRATQYSPAKDCR